jgi:uncharacterized membrane protein YjjP (DUF1212 family)
MTPTLKAKHDSSPKSSQWIYLLTVIAGMNAGFILSLLGALDWQECLIVMFALGALAGGAVFTLLEMRALSQRD